MFLVFPKKKEIFFFFFPLRVKKNLFFSLSFLDNFAELSALSGYNIRCKHTQKRVYNVILMNE